MIADDNRDLSEVLSDYLELCPDIEIAGVSDNGSEAIELLNITKPDVLLLDIVIPGIDGLEVLHRIQSGNCWKPCVFIMSALYSTEIREQAFSMGASFFFVKPLDIEFVVEKILAVPVLKGGDCPKASPVFEFAGDISNIDEKITAILLENGVPANVQGFRYIRDMIGLFCRQEYRGRPTELYEKVAMNYNTTSMRVKKAIHYAVKVAWNRHSAKKADGIFHSMQKHKSGQPGNSQFMYAVAGKLAEG
jgi:two-component system response regulator (stage 0 sporulation protein A)